MNFINILNKNSTKKELIKDLIYSVNINFAGTTISIIYNIKHMTFNVNHLVKSFNKDPLIFIDQVLNDINYYREINKLHKLLFNKEHYLLKEPLPQELLGNIEEEDDNNIYFFFNDEEDNIEEENNTFNEEKDNISETSSEDGNIYKKFNSTIDNYESSSEEDHNKVVHNKINICNGLWLRIEFLSFIIKYIFQKFTIIEDTYILQQIFHLANSDQDILQEMQNIDQLYSEYKEDISKEEKIEYFNELLSEYFPNSYLLHNSSESNSINHNIFQDKDLIKYKLNDNLQLNIILVNGPDKYNMHIEYPNTIYLYYDKVNNMYLQFIKNNELFIINKLPIDNTIKEDNKEITNTINQFLIDKYETSKDQSIIPQSKDQSKDQILQEFILSSLPKPSKELVHKVINYYYELYGIRILPKMAREIIEKYAIKGKSINKIYYFKK